jgi:hypothetical protein
MNSPTHLIAGAVTAQVVMAAIGPRASRPVQVAAGIGAFGLAMLSHLLLDAIPHYNWIVYVDWLHRVPFAWLLREAIFSLPVILLAVYCGRDHPVINFFGLFGGMYPDLEKVAYLDFHLPQRFVLFPWHSLRCTPFDGRHAQSTYIAQEMAIFLVLAAATYGLSVWRMRKDGSLGNGLLVPAAESS